MSAKRDPMGGRALVRLYFHNGLYAFVCDRCAPLHRHLDHNKAPLVPVAACSSCGIGNFVRRFPEGWTLQEARDALQ